MTENLGDVFNNVYVAFQNHGMQEMEDGQKVEVATRAMHVAVAFE
jgi:cold shock CspA family protein